MKKGLLATIAGLTVGGIAAGKVANLNLTFLPDKVKPFLPMVAGYFLAKNKNQMLQAVGAGMIAVGGMKVVGALAPGLGISAIEDDFAMVNGTEGAYALGAAQDPLAASYALAGTGAEMNTDLVG